MRAANYQHPRGDDAIWRANDAVWKQALLPLLVDQATATAITGGADRCSLYCLSEDGDGRYKGYQFVDNSRFKLTNCSHHSPHLQCIIKRLVHFGGCWTYCPIRDTPQCRETKDAQDKRGEDFFWAPQDYENFAKAFFRNQKLANAFLKPQYR